MINHPQVITIFMGRIHRQMVGLALGFSHDLIQEPSWGFIELPVIISPRDGAYDGRKINHQEPSRRAGQASTIWIYLGGIVFWRGLVEVKSPCHDSGSISNHPPSCVLMDTRNWLPYVGTFASVSFGFVFVWKHDFDEHRRAFKQSWQEKNRIQRAPGTRTSSTYANLCDIYKCAIIKSWMITYNTIKGMIIPP